MQINKANNLTIAAIYISRHCRTQEIQIKEFYDEKINFFNRSSYIGTLFSAAFCTQRLMAPYNGCMLQ